MSIQRVAGGGLISFQTITFPIGRSKRIGLALKAPTYRSSMAGKLYKVDRAGSQVVPLEYEIHFEFLISPITTLYSVQTQLDALYTLFITSPVGLLTVFAVGDSTVHISGQARLETMTEITNEPNYMIFDLGFFAEAGLVG